MSDVTRYEDRCIKGQLIVKVRKSKEASDILRLAGQGWAGIEGGGINFIIYVISPGPGYLHLACCLLPVVDVTPYTPTA